MEILITLFVFVLYFGGFYLMMRRHVFEVLLGTLLLTHATNMLLVAMGGWRAEENPPILVSGSDYPLASYADPVPQALILTAIVIGFGVTAYLVVLILRGNEEFADMELTERPRAEDEA